MLSSGTESNPGRISQAARRRRQSPTLKSGEKLSAEDLTGKRVLAATGKFDNESDGSVSDSSISGLSAEVSQTKQQVPIDDKTLREKILSIQDLCKDFLNRFLPTLDKDYGKAHRNENGDFDMGANFDRILVKVVSNKIIEKKGPQSPARFHIMMVIREL